MHKLIIATVTYNAEQNLEIFLPSILANQESIDRVCVLDNASSDKTLQIIEKFQKDHPSIQVEIDASIKNIGYAAGINKAIKSALDFGAEFILVTNNDLIFQPKALRPLLLTQDRYSADAVGIPTKDVLPESESAPMVEFPQGGTILFSKRFFELVGFYDETLFFGGDELDFIYRVKKYNQQNQDKIICVDSLESFGLIDHRTKHDTRYKLRKAKFMLQGYIHVLLKHEFNPFSLGLFSHIWGEVSMLGKKSVFRKLILIPLAVRGWVIETLIYYK